MRFHNLHAAMKRRRKIATLLRMSAHACERGLSALRAIDQQFIPDLIVLDLDLSQVRGIDVHQENAPPDVGRLKVCLRADTTASLRRR
jgi:CheY-like chemotaxis protein